jgi:oligopeptide/dipeptide ABC transporter ATP-binding protein
MTETQPPTIEPLLKVDQLKKYFPIRRGVFSRVVAHVRAVDDISFAIGRGKTLSLVGESGCGKTTAGRTLLRLLEPTAGAIRFDQQNVRYCRGKELARLRRNMQIVFQDPYGSLNPRMTVRALLEEGLIVHGMGMAPRRREIVEETLRRVGLEPGHMHQYPHEFSGGQRQRISIARALVLQPKFLVLDEPISALDVSIQSQIINLLEELREAFDLTYLFISHDLSVVEYLSDDVCVMYLGKIVESGPVGPLYENPLHPYTEALLSSIPTTDPTTKKDRILLPGDVPSPINPPPGCPFHPRCHRVMEVCRHQEPPWVQIGRQKAWCHAVAKDHAETAKINPTAASS